MLVTLYLSKQSELFVKYHLMSDMLDLKSPIGQLIFAHAGYDNPALRKKAVYDLPEKIEVRVPRTHRSGRTVTLHKDLWIDPESMRYLDRAIKRLIKTEMMIAIEYGQKNGCTKHEIIFRLMEKYGFEESDLTFDALKKFEQRHSKVGKPLGFG